MAYTSDPIFEKILNGYPIFSLQIIYYQVVQMQKLDILFVKFHFNSFKNGIFLIFSIWFNVNIFTVLTQKIVWEPVICSLFLEKVYLRLRENWHKFSLKIALKTRGTRLFKYVICEISPVV